MITHFCIIRNRTIIVDGETIMEAKVTPDEFLSSAYTFLGVDYPKFYKMDNLSKLGFLAMEALVQKRILANEYRSENVSLILSNANSSLDTDIRFSESMKTIASPALFVYTLPNIVAGEICIRHKIKGENAFFVCEKFDPELMFDYVSMVVSQNSQSACIAGWVDVLGGQHDVFLYLIEKNKPALFEHSAKQLRELYNT